MNIIPDRKEITPVSRELENAHILINILSIVAREDSLENMLDLAVEELLSVSWLSLLPMGGVFVVDEGGQVLRLKAKKKLAPILHGLCARVPFGHCLCGRAAQSGEVQYARCVDERHDISFDNMAPHGHYNVPIMSGKTILGVLVVYLPHGHERDETEIDFLKNVANTLSLVIQVKNKEAALEKTQDELESYLSDLDLQNATLQRHAKELVVLYEEQNDLLSETEQKEQKSRHASQHDPLTKLPNRRYFAQCCRRAISKTAAPGKKGAFLFLDLDGFKAINDTLGHSVGDAVLVEIAGRLKNNVRQNDIVARFGGDEFVLFLPGLPSVEIGEKIARKIIGALNEPFRLDGEDISLGASCGLSLFPDHGERVEALIDIADKAMYKVKARGKNDVGIADFKD